MAGPITVIAKLFAPLVWLLTKSTNGVLRLCGIDPNSDEETVTEEDLLLMADAGHKREPLMPRKMTSSKMCLPLTISQ